jgi:4'-phosphopantetheinyl transferase
VPRNFIRSSASNFLPAPSSGLVVIHLMETAGHEVAEDCLLLSPAELARAARFRFESDRCRWVGWRAEMRRILGRYLGIHAADVPLVESPNGKPLLALPHDGLHFNLSHSTDSAVLVVSGDGPVGVDLESTGRAAVLLECADVFCHPEEIADLPADPRDRERALLGLWTGKEALLKALGTGFTHPPDQLRIRGDSAYSDRPLPGIGALRLHFPDPPPGQMLAVAIPRGIQDPQIAVQFAA